MCVALPTHLTINLRGPSRPLANNFDRAVRACGNCSRDTSQDKSLEAITDCIFVGAAGFSNRFEILPRTNLSKRLLKPAEPTKMQSAFHSSAALQSSCLGSPSLKTQVTLIFVPRNSS